MFAFHWVHDKILFALEKVTLMFPLVIALIPGALIIIVPRVIICLNYSEEEFVCPHCDKRFYTKWYKLMLSPCRLKMFRYTARLRCPACKKTGICWIPDEYPEGWKPLYYRRKR